MATHNRIQDINSRYQRVESQNIFNPPIQFRKSEVRSVVTQNVMHPTITNQKPRYLNSLIASPIGSHFTSQKNFKQQAVTHGITRSRVTVTQTPGILQANTIAPTVYQIVQPIVQITPAIVSQRRSGKRISHNRTLQIARGAQQNLQIPSPPPLSSRRKSKSQFVRKGCCQTYCGCCSSCCTGPSCRQCLGCKCCPWWLSILLCLLLLLLPLVLGLIYLCTSPRFNHSKLEQSLIPFNKTQVTVQQNQTTTPIQSQNETQQQNKQTVDQQYINQLNRILKEANETQENQSNQTNTNVSDHPLTSNPPPAFNNTNLINKQKVTITNISCPFGYFFFGKKCLSCPDQSAWNGTNCIKRILIQPKGSITRINVNSSSRQTIIQPKVAQQNPDIYVADAWSVVQPKTHSKNIHLKRNS